MNVAAPHFDGHALAVVQHTPGQGVRLGKMPDVRTEADPLHLAAHAQALSVQRAHDARSQSCTRLLPVSAIARRAPHAAKPYGQLSELGPTACHALSPRL